MNIALIGYGKMGKMIETIAIERGHQVILKIDVDNLSDFTLSKIGNAHVAIEFTKPETAFTNIIRCIEYEIPVVSGSTGWYDRLDKLKTFCKEHNGSMLCTSNFSLGVNVFFEINRRLARIMNKFPDYSASIEETHHTQKLDAPSGTAITLAEGVLAEISRIEKWELDDKNSGDRDNSSLLPIHAIRRDNVPGTHNVKYSSDIDEIEIIHTAHNRKGFALGAVLAAEYIHDKKGVFTMQDLLKL